MRLSILAILFVLTLQILAKDVARFTIKATEASIDAPVYISLDHINYNSDKGVLKLYERISKKEIEVPLQLESGHSARLWFVLNGITSKGDKREFVLKREPGDTIVKTHVSLQKDAQDVCLSYSGQPVLKYRYAVTLPPKEADPLYKRSAYIHPLYSPAGAILTKIQPKDHYHHYGIWGPWTKTHIDGRNVDFWNLKLGEGTVQFANFLSEVEGDVFSGFKSLQQHIDFGAKGADNVAINEVLDVRVWNAKTDVRIIDYTTTLNTPLNNGIMLDAYRYGGGIGYRATEKWHKDNCTVLTSEGKTRVDADGSNARWCIVEGESDVDAGRSGILFLSHPSNRMHPEPMRVWPLNANGGRGDMYFEFVPIRHHDWKLNPNQNYTLKYRMVVFDGKMDKETAEMYWNSFAAQPEIKISK